MALIDELTAKKTQGRIWKQNPGLIISIPVLFPDQRL
jgi:hypothetical protein